MTDKLRQDQIEGVVSKYVRQKQTEREVLAAVTMKSYCKTLARVVVIAAKLAQSAYDDSEGDCIYCGAEQYPDGYTHAGGCLLAKLENVLVELDKASDQ